MKSEETAVQSLLKDILYRPGLHRIMFFLTPSQLINACSLFWLLYDFQLIVNLVFRLIVRTTVVVVTPDSPIDGSVSIVPSLQPSFSAQKHQYKSTGTKYYSLQSAEESDKEKLQVERALDTLSNDNFWVKISSTNNNCGHQNESSASAKELLHKFMTCAGFVIPIPSFKHEKILRLLTALPAFVIQEKSTTPFEYRREEILFFASKTGHIVHIAPSDIGNAEPSKSGKSLRAPPWFPKDQMNQSFGSESAPKNVLDLVLRIVSTTNISLSEKDKYLIDTLDNRFPVQLQSELSQIQEMGLCVSTKHLSIPHSSHILQLRLSEKCSVTVDTQRLSHVGISLLMWAIPPSAQHRKQLLLILQTTSFKNCFLNYLFNDLRYGQGRTLVIPMGWIYWLEIPHSFLKSHAKVGDLAVAVASPFPQKILSFFGRRIARQVDEQFVQESEDSALEHLRHETTDTGMNSNIEGPSNPCLVAHGQAAVNKKIKFPQMKRYAEKVNVHLPPGSESNGGRGEHLLLVRRSSDYELLYQPMSPQGFNLTGIGASAEAVGFGVGASSSWQPSTLHQTLARNAAEGFVVCFNSLPHFLRLKVNSVSEGQIINRMKWLQRVLDYKAIFPRGVNCSFLNAVMSSSALNEPVSLFPNEDCRVGTELLRKNKVKVRREKDDELIGVCFDENRPDGQGQWVWVAKCQPDKGKLHVAKCYEIDSVPSGEYELIDCDLV